MRRTNGIHRTLSLRGLSLSLGAHPDEAVPAAVATARALAQKVIEGHISASEALHELQLHPRFTIAGSTITFTAPHNPLFPALPQHYGYKGGAARYALSMALGIEAQAMAPRDLDLVRRFGTDASLDETLLQQVNPYDFAHGAKIEEIKSTEAYLHSRDLTVNEVVIFATIGSASILALLDLLGCTLRPCRYRGGTMRSRRRLAPMTVAKCLRLAAEGDQCITDQSSAERSRAVARWVVVGVPDQQEVTSFALGIQLKKALERGVDVAHRFLTYCVGAGISFSQGNVSAASGVGDLLQQILEDLPEGHHFFTPEENQLLAAFL